MIGPADQTAFNSSVGVLDIPRQKSDLDSHLERRRHRREPIHYGSLMWTGERVGCLNPGPRPKCLLVVTHPGCDLLVTQVDQDLKPCISNSTMQPAEQPVEFLAQA